MRRKTITPQGQPRQPAEIISLAAWRQENRETKQGDIDILLPPGGSVEDRFQCITLRDSVREWGARRGDKFVIYETDDVHKGEMVALTDHAGEIFYIGQLDFDECYYYLEETAHHVAKECHRAGWRIIGRVVDAQRIVRGKPQRIQTALSFRPVRERARVYQFKGGA